MNETADNRTNIWNDLSVDTKQSHSLISVCKNHKIMVYNIRYNNTYLF